MWSIGHHYLETVSNHPNFGSLRFPRGTVSERLIYYKIKYTSKYLCFWNIIRSVPWSASLVHAHLVYHILRRMIDCAHVHGDVAQCISENIAWPWVGLRPHHYTTSTAAWPSSRNPGEGWTLCKRNTCEVTNNRWRWYLSWPDNPVYPHYLCISTCPHISIKFETHILSNT